MVIVQAALVEALVYGAESGGLDVRAHIEGGDVADVEGGLGLACPSAFFVEVGDF